MFTKLTVFSQQEVSKIASPFLVGYLIEYFAVGSTETKLNAFLYAGAIVVSFILACFLHHAAFFSIECLGLKLRTAVTSLVFKKVC